MIEARIILDSSNPVGNRLITSLLTMPKWLLGEFARHRVFSFNSGSSRAIPSQKILDEVQKNPFFPSWWGANQKGMSASESISNPEAAQQVWAKASKFALGCARELQALNVHKQLTNRLLEPFSWVKVVVTATDWANFYEQRCAPKQAQPEMVELAYKMLEAHLQSVPVKLAEGEWHLPFVTDQEKEDLPGETLIKISTARVARTSYHNFYGKIDYQEDERLHDFLIQEKHFSPLEGPCRALGAGYRVKNLLGWQSYRATIPSEHHVEWRPEVWLARRSL